MKNSIIILAIVFIASAFSFIKKDNSAPLADSNEYHVMALSGLKMRKSPDLKGAKIMTIPYNAAVTKINDGKSYGTLTIKELEDFSISGEWVKVKYNGQEGYVFGGFLTQFPMPEPTLEEFDYEQYSSKLEEHLSKHFKGKKYDFEKYGECEVSTENDCVCGYTTKYEAGHSHKYNSCAEAGANYMIEIENITLAEAYFLIRALDMNGHKDRIGKDVITYEKSEKYLSLYPDEGVGCSQTIRMKKKNSVEIEMYCGC